MIPLDFTLCCYVTSHCYPLNFLFPESHNSHFFDVHLIFSFNMGTVFLVFILCDASSSHHPQPVRKLEKWNHFSTLLENIKYRFEQTFDFCFTLVISHHLICTDSCRDDVSFYLRMSQRKICQMMYSYKVCPGRLLVWMSKHRTFTQETTVCVEKKSVLTYFNLRT